MKILRACIKRLTRMVIPACRLAGIQVFSWKITWAPGKDIPGRRLFIHPLGPLISIVLLVSLFSPARAGESLLEDTWANWEKRLEYAYRDVQSHKMPGRCVGIIVPSSSRQDILPMTAIGYETLAKESPSTIVFLMETSSSKSSGKSGIVLPGIDLIDTSFGGFAIDNDLRFLFAQNSSNEMVRVDPDLFVNEVPKVLLTQLAQLKFLNQKKSHRLKILPIVVHFEEPETQIKDWAPALVEIFRNSGRESEIGFVILSDLSQSVGNLDVMLGHDNTLLTALRSQDVDVLLTQMSETTQLADRDALSLGTLMLRILSSDHIEILAYAHSRQLVLSKEKDSPTSFVTAAFASAPPIKSGQPHVDREKIVEKFDELTRSDMLALTRQTCVSAVDSTAAKPPSLIGREASKKWPVYVTLYDSDGQLAGQAGSHVPVGPLEESLRKFSLEAVRQAKPTLSKTNIANYIVDVSIPYGFEKVSRPEDLIPLLHGVVVYQKLKASAFHPDAWRKNHDPHQLLSSICTQLGLKPWAYATKVTRLESFRILAFNEKEPFQDLGAAIRKKKKKKTSPDAAEEDLNFGGDDGGGGGGGGGGGSPFSF